MKDYQREVLAGIDTVVLAVGYAPATELEGQLAAANVPFVRIGDCVEPRKVLDAIWEGFARAYEL
jgi:2-enoate reductase